MSSQMVKKSISRPPHSAVPHISLFLITLPDSDGAPRSESAHLFRHVTLSLTPLPSGFMQMRMHNVKLYLVISHSYLRLSTAINSRGSDKVFVVEDNR